MNGELAFSRAKMPGVKTLKSSSLERLRKIKYNYELKEFEETNKILTEMAVDGITGVMTRYELTKRPDDLHKSLSENKIFIRDMKRLTGRVSSSIPCVGLVSGGITIAKHVVESYVSDDVEEEKPTPPAKEPPKPSEK